MTTGPKVTLKELKELDAKATPIMNSADLQALIKATLLWFTAYIVAIIEINFFNMSCSAYELTTSICVLFLLSNHFNRSA